MNWIMIFHITMASKFVDIGSGIMQSELQNSVKKLDMLKDKLLKEVWQCPMEVYILENVISLLISQSHVTHQILGQTLHAQKKVMKLVLKWSATAVICFEFILFFGFIMLLLQAKWNLKIYLFEFIFFSEYMSSKQKMVTWVFVVLRTLL